MNVYTDTNNKLEYIFKEFDKVYISLSGGKDSGVLLNLCIDYIRKNNLKIKIGVLFIDLEAFYEETVNFIKRIIEANLDIIVPFWVCLPLKSDNAVSMYEPYWIFWDPCKKDKWVRTMPAMDYVINSENHKFGFYKENMTFEEFIEYFGDWYGTGEKTACLVGIREQESLNRWRAINSERNINKYKNKNYSTKVTDQVYNFYPIHKWRVEDIWVYNGKFKKDYNKIYDLFYKAGISLHKMRICEPFGSAQKAGLNMYRIIEPQTWIKVVDRVSGANLGNIYCNTKLLGRNFKLPNGHTWESYTNFLLDTMPQIAKEQYKQKFKVYIKYWQEHGASVKSEYINLLLNTRPNDVEDTGKVSTRGNKLNHNLRFKTIPDEVPELEGKGDFLSWKRMCLAILKNDIYCKTLG